MLSLKKQFSNKEVIYEFLLLKADNKIQNWKYKFNHGYTLFAGRGGSAGGKFRIALGLPVGAVMNCADNSGIYINYLAPF